MSSHNAIFLTRRETFAASHRLYRSEWSREKNKAVFDKCANPHGHGHNYTLEVTLKGRPHPETGFIMSISELKKLIDTHVMVKVDHRYLNKETPPFDQLIPTTENMVAVFWDWLHPALGPLLYEVRLGETENNFSYYRG